MITITPIHSYLTLGGITDIEGFFHHARVYLMTKHLYVVTIDNDYSPLYRVLTTFAILAHRESSARALLGELIDANYNIVTLEEYSMA
jgi:hypothetical protein